MANGDNPFDPIATTDQRFAQLSAQRGFGPTALDYVGHDVVTGPGQTQTIGVLRGGWAQQPQTFNDLVGQAIDARRGIEERRRQLYGVLPSANRREAVAIGAELRGLDHDEHFIEWSANQRRIQSHMDMLDQDREFRRERDSRVDEQATNAILGMRQLEGLLHSGQISQDEYEDGLMNIRYQNYEGLLHHKEAGAHWDSLAYRSDKLRDELDRASIREISKFGSKYGVSPQIDPNTGQPSFELTRAAAMQTPQGKTAALKELDEDLYRTHRYGIGVSSIMNNAYGGTMTDPKDPKTFTATDPNDTKTPQTHVQVMFTTPQGQAHSVIFPKQQFDQIKSEYEPAYREIVGQAQTTTGQATTPEQPQTVRVRHPNGQTGSIPASQLQDALNQGYQQVGQ